MAGHCYHLAGGYTAMHECHATTGCNAMKGYNAKKGCNAKNWLYCQKRL
jgi:predicted dienelactone hydrolase